MTGHRQAGQGHDHSAGSGTFLNELKSGRRLSAGEGCLYGDILGPLRLLALLLLDSVKLGLHPEHFVCFGNEGFEGNERLRPGLLCRWDVQETLSKAWTLAASSDFGPNSRKHLIYT